MIETDDAMTLPKCAANYTPLSPLSFLKRTATVYPNHLSVIYGNKRYTWSETYRRSRQLASALCRIGVKSGDCVAVLAANTPEMYEVHFGVPMSSAVLCTINCRLDVSAITFILKHSQAKVLITDREFSGTIKQVMDRLDNPPRIFDIDDPNINDGELLGEFDYEALLQRGDPDFQFPTVTDEWDDISVN